LSAGNLRQRLVQLLDGEERALAWDEHDIASAAVEELLPALHLLLPEGQVALELLSCRFWSDPGSTLFLYLYPESANAGSRCGSEAESEKDQE
jgi:hypothetical protein